MGQAINKYTVEDFQTTAAVSSLTSKVADKVCPAVLLEPTWTILPETKVTARRDMVVGTAACEDADDSAPHYSPTVRACEVDRAAGSSGSCGFHLTRSKWDPYPWVSGVEAGSAAEAAGILSGDCVLEVNGEDVLGLKICEVAEKVKARADRVALLLWNSGCDPHCNPESLCCGPMPTNLQRLSTSVAAILAALECPVCLDTIPPPAHQCANGHLLCVRCRARADRCPVCRVRFCRGRSLLADRVFTALTDAFGLGDAPEARRAAGLRDKLFGGRREPPREPKISPPKNKFLARVLGKSSSVENLSPRRRDHHAPHDDNDGDFAGLKAKSLSTGEIFRPISPAPSTQRLLSVPGTLSPRRPASYHGSCESFEVPDEEVDDPLCFCPCDAGCEAVVCASAVLEHVRENHEGPLVQYFRPKVTLGLPSPLEDTALVCLSDSGRTFFLKVAQQAAASSDTLVWLWYLGSADGAAGYQLHLTLRGHGARGKVMTFRSEAFSLAEHSWADVVGARRGVCLPAQLLVDSFATELETGIAIAVDVEVKVVTDL